MGGSREVPRARPEWVLDRPALRADLDDATAEADVTLVVAAAGSGKSTLLGEWADHRRAPVLWVRLRLTDTDPISCGQRIVAAVRTVVDDVVGEGLPDLTDERDRRRLAESLVSGARRRPGSVLVIEDLHRADPTTSLLLAELVDDVSRSLPVVVASRVDPHWPLSEWRLQGRVRELRQHDLDFDDAVAHELLQTIAAGRLRPEDASKLVDRCQGWAAGLVLSGLSARSSADPAAFAAAFSGADHSVADYLFDEVYAALDERERRFLLSTSVCQRFDAELAEALTGDEHAWALLRRLADRLMLIRPIPDLPGSYRYHDLFREMLRQQLDLEHPGRATTLVRLAADVSARRGDLAARCGYLAQIGDHAQIADLVAHRLREAFLDRTHRELLGCLELIPHDQRDLRTTLTMATVGLTTGLSSRVRDLCERAQGDPAFGADEAVTVDRLRCALVEWGEPPDAVIATSTRLLALGDEVGEGAQGLRLLTSVAGASHRAVALCSRGRARDLLGDAAGALADLAAVDDAAPDVVWAVYAAATHALVAAREGDAATAGGRASWALSAVREVGIDGHPMVASAHLARAVIALGHDDLVTTGVELDRSRIACLGNNRWVSLVEERIWRAELHRREGDVGGVKLCLDEIGLHPPAPPRLQSDLLALRARVHLDAGELAEAARLLHAVPVSTAAVRAAWAALPAPTLPGGVALTDREQEVLERLVTRRTSAEIGTELHLSVHTVKTHQRHIYQKLGVSSRRDAIAAAEVLGLIST